MGIMRLRAYLHLIRPGGVPPRLVGHIEFLHLNVGLRQDLLCKMSPTKLKIRKG